MGSRERKRAERRKRKERRAAAGEAEAGHRSAAGSRQSEGSDGRGQSSSELRNQEAREALKPLHTGERPGIVTIGAVISTLLAVSVLAAYVAGATVDGERPPIAQIIVPAALMGVMAYGMWRARYWAVLGFQVVLLILIMAASLGLLQAAGVAQVIGNCVLLAVAGTLFFRMIKAMARIQMPQRLPRE